MRVDAEFFSKRHLRVAALLENARKESIRELTHISDGNHFAIADEFADEGVPYYRGGDVVGNFFVEQCAPYFITPRAYHAEHMKRSHLIQGDVLLSIIGTIGEASLVTSKAPATCSCKLAILRPKTVLPEYLAVFFRSEMGRSQTARFTRGAVQMGLLLEDMDQIYVARFSNKFEMAVAELVKAGRQQLEDSKRVAAEGEETLTAALGLREWQPPEPLTYTRRASEVAPTKRLDAEFHRPKVEALRAKLAHRFLLVTIGAVGEVDNGQTASYDENGEVPIIRSGDLSNIEDDARFLRASYNTPIFQLQRGDVLVSSIGFGSIGKVQVFDKSGTYGTISEVTVIRQKELNAYYVCAFLRSRFGPMQIDRFITGATGQLHLYKRDVREIFVPVISAEEQEKFQTLANAAHTARQRARALLAAAQRAVEIGIEESEKKALKFLSATLP